MKVLLNLYVFPEAAAKTALPCDVLVIGGIGGTNSSSRSRLPLVSGPCRAFRHHHAVVLADHPVFSFPATTRQWRTGGLLKKGCVV